MNIRRLTPDDAHAFRRLRLFALCESPTAFGSSYEEEQDLPMSVVERRLATTPDRAAFGAFENHELVGSVVLGRDNMRKLAHKAFIWGMYVSPNARGRSVGRHLLVEALTFARSIDSIRQVNLSVTAGNIAAFRLYESVGFRVYGREPDALCIDGRLHDELHMYLRVK
jgi:ribosomal protein S18 acetylase RimI-like enzyme